MGALPEAVLASYWLLGLSLRSGLPLGIERL